MRILDNTKSLTALSIDTTNGLGNIQPLECLITEELNGLYEAEMTVLVSDEHFNDLSVGSILLLNTEKDNQMFRVYYISKPINQRCEVRLQHITYDLTKTPVKPFTSSGAAATCLALKNNVLGSTPFDIQTNIENTTSNFTLDIPRSFRECLGGYEGSMLDVFRGEYEWDNLTVKMLSRRGADNGVRISYGKNLTDFKQEENIENVYDGVLGYAVVDDVTYTASNYFNKTGATNPRIKNVDFSNDYESGDIPTDAELIQKETNYANNNDIEIPNINITISFIPLWQTEEYKNILPLERVSLGDTVHIYFDKLNVEASARVIKTVWNCLTEKYEEIELGNAKANLNTIIDNAVDNGVNKALSDIDIDTSSIEEEMNNLSRLIVNGLGLHISKDDVGRIILHNAETIAQSKYQYMISATGFVVSDNYGQEGSWRSGWTTSGEAYMNSLSTIILRAMQIYGSVITFGDPNDKYIVAQNYANSSNVLQGVSFDGSGTIRMQPQEAFYVNNCTSDGNNYYNRIAMNKNTSSTNTNNAIFLQNYDDTQNYITANFIELDAHYTYNGATYNRTVIHNYATHTGTSVSANLILMEARDGYSYLYLNNRNQSGQYLANQILFSYSTAQNNLYLRNYNQAANSIGNLIQLQTTANSGFVQIRNHKVGTTDYANAINAQTTSTTNFITLANYDFSNNVTSNYLMLSASSTSRSISIQQNSPGKTKEINEIFMSYLTNNSKSTIEIDNGRYDNSSTDYTMLNKLEMVVSNSNTNYITITNRNNSAQLNNMIEMKAASTSSNELNINNYIKGTKRNYIEMKAGTTNSIFIRNNATTASRYNQLEMSDGGNFNLYSSDDMNLKAMDICRVEGVNTLVLSGLDIQLWKGTRQVSLYLSDGYVRYS